MMEMELGREKGERFCFLGEKSNCDVFCGYIWQKGPGIQCHDRQILQTLK